MNCNIDHEVFSDVEPDPSLTTVRRGLAVMNSVQAGRDHRHGRRFADGRRQDHVADV